MLALYLLCCFLVMLPQGTESSDISSRLWIDVNQVTQNELLANIRANIGEELTIPCLMEYELTHFAWYLCHSDCRSSDAEWKIVVVIDDGSTKIYDEKKFGLDSNGSLVLKKVHPENNKNWVRCFYKERLVGMDHRSTIILIDREAPFITMKGAKEYLVFEGMPLFLDCDAKGYPVPWVAWIRDDQVLRNSTDGLPYLLLRGVTTKEAGNYTCTVRNFLGEAKYIYQVTVKDPTREDAQGISSSATPCSLGTGIGYGIAISVAVSIPVCCIMYVTRKNIYGNYTICCTSNVVHEDDLASISGHGIEISNEGLDLQADKN